MNIARTETFARELISIIQQADTVKGEVDKMSGYLEIATKLNDLQQTKQLSDGRKQALETFEKIATIACEKANRSDLEGARTLATDLMHRLNAARREYEEFRALANEFEFQVAAGELEGEQRAAAETQLTKSKERVEKRVEQAALLVPNKPVVLLGGV